MDPIVLILRILLLVLAVCVLVWGVRSLTSAWGVGEPYATTILVFTIVLGLLILYLYFPLNFPRRA
jgi:hypothetical protein